MSKNLKRGLLIGAAAVAIILLTKTCTKNICGDCARGDGVQIILLEDNILGANNKFVNAKHGELFVQTPVGKLYPLDKRTELEPACFANANYHKNNQVDIEDVDLGEVTKITRKDILPEGRRGNYPPDFPTDYVNSSLPDLKADGNLWAVDLKWENTTIIFINFDKDGRLESRELTQKAASKSGTVYGDINQIMQPSSGTPVNEYKAVQYFLTNLVHGFNPKGRPLPEDIDTEGFMNRVLNPLVIPEDKTPFYHKFDLTASPSARGEIDAKTGHIFFYVLLDDHLRFQRDNAGIVPYTPPGDQILHTPFVQYPIVPSEKLMKTNPERVDVMTVHFIQGGTMTDGMGVNPKCKYVYDIAVIASGQVGTKHKTPLMIDPEVDTEGPIP